MAEFKPMNVPNIVREGNLSITKTQSEKELTPLDHFEEALIANNKSSNLVQHGGQSELTGAGIFDPKDHFTHDVNAMNAGMDGPHEPMVNNQGKFSGSSTLINPMGNSLTEQMDRSLADANTAATRETAKYEIPPLSPLQPFTKMTASAMHLNTTTGNIEEIDGTVLTVPKPLEARRANIMTYNRFHEPVADLEFRKGFHNVFISRPECYINYSKGKITKQCENNADFVSTFNRCPYILDLLSPVYVTGTFGPNEIQHNWNYLLSNRIIGIDLDPTLQLEKGNSSTLSTTGASISYGTTMDYFKPGEIKVEFRETKYLEVYECIRLWMLYINNVSRGIFNPAFHLGDKATNGWSFMWGDANSQIKGPQQDPTYELSNKTKVDAGLGTDYTTSPTYDFRYKPYSRTLDYCASMFDIFTNESMTKILSWTKWYGIFPIAVSLNGFKYDAGGMIKGDGNLTVSVSFAYSAVCTNDAFNLVEFNYNSGVLDDVGKVRNAKLKTSYPFLLREDKSDGTYHFNVKDSYIGAAGMFTGTPYIAQAIDKTSNFLNTDMQYSGGSKANPTVPFLQFLPLPNEMNQVYNLGLVNETDLPSNMSIIGIKYK